MPLNRRVFLSFLAAFPALAACGQRSALTNKGLAMEPISAEELELLENPLACLAYFARIGLPQGVLEIRQRGFGGERSLLQGIDVKDANFVNCVFDLSNGNENKLENVPVLQIHPLARRPLENRRQSNRPPRLSRGLGYLRPQFSKRYNMAKTENGIERI